jgi:hypothetical protein
MAIAMTLPHNLLLRGLNSIILQGPHVREAQDITDFLFFCRAWLMMVEEHHGAEDRYFFPELERLTGKPNVAESEKAAHEKLHEGLENLKAFIEKSGDDVGKYSWEGEGGLREAVDRFAGKFREHLVEEIEMLMSLKVYESEELDRIWKGMEVYIKANLEHAFVSTYLVQPFI